MNDDFLIAAGPRHSGKTTELIKKVCKINRTEGRNVAVIVCWSRAEAHHIASQAADLGFHDMPYPISVEEIRCGSGHGRGSFYKYAFEGFEIYPPSLDNAINRIAEEHGYAKGCRHGKQCKRQRPDK